MTEARLDELLAPGVVPDDVPELAPLLAARPLLAAFSTLFHGSEAEILMRLLVLREMGQTGHDAEARRWAPDSLRQHFAYLEKLKEQGILILAGKTKGMDEKTFGIVVLEAENEMEARKRMEEDPGVYTGIMCAELFPYHVALMRT